MTLRERLSRPTAGWLSQLIRYALSGGLAFVVDFGLLWLMTTVLGLYYQVGVGCGYLAGLAITYTLSTLWIFDEHRTSNRLVEIVGFALIGLVGMVATHCLMYLLTDLWLGEDYYLVAKLLTTALVTILNFILKKYILFTKTQ